MPTGNLETACVSSIFGTQEELSPLIRGFSYLFSERNGEFEARPDSQRGLFCRGNGGLFYFSFSVNRQTVFSSLFGIILINFLTH
jgi:hypothetical protein